MQNLDAFFSKQSISYESNTHKAIILVDIQCSTKQIARARDIAGLSLYTAPEFQIT